MSERTRALRTVLIAGSIFAVAAGIWWWGQSQPGKVHVSAQPADASVRIGEHTSTGTLDVTLPPGDYELKVEHRDYYPLSMAFQVSGRDQLELTPKLIPKAKP